MSGTDALELRRLEAELRAVIYRLGRVDEIPAWTTDPMPTRLRYDPPEQTRADAWLTIIEHVMNMQPGDKLTVEWHGRGDRLATLTYTPDAGDQTG